MFFFFFLNLTFLPFIVTRLILVVLKFRSNEITFYHLRDLINIRIIYYFFNNFQLKFFNYSSNNAVRSIIHDKTVYLSLIKSKLLV